MDNSGIEKSEGQIPTTLHGWAVHLIGLLEVLNIRQIDLLGYWMGGAAAQHVALAAPQGLVCKLSVLNFSSLPTPKSRDVYLISLPNCRDT